MGYPHDFDGLQAQHAATLELLAEVRGYLMRLAPVPLTKKLCAKIDAHIEEPSRTVAHAAAAREAARQTTLTGGLYSPMGLPLLTLEMTGNTVVLRTEIPKSYGGEADLTKMLLSGLRKSPTIGLKVPARRLL